MQVKICGITNLEDALCAADCGAAALGFIFYPPSPRYIEPQKAAAIIGGLPSQVVKVGVFVNAGEQDIQRIAADCGLDMLQLHGDETPAFCRQFPQRLLIKALELKTDADLRKVDRYDVAAILVDARHAGLYGGTGKTSNWELAQKVTRPLILSGGLNQDNVQDGLQKVRPAALDINSGVEKRPGKKDAYKVKRILQIIKQATTGETSPQLFIRRDRT